MIESTNILAFWTPGPLEIVMILIVAVLIWGKRLPEIARGAGKSVSEFKKGIKEASTVTDDVLNDVQHAGDEIINDVKSGEGLDQPDNND